MDAVEELVRSAGDLRVDDLDIDALNDRVTSRRRGRRVGTSMTAVVLALVVGISALFALRGNDQTAPARRVDAPGATPSVAWHQMTPAPVGLPVRGPAGNTIAVTRDTISHTTDLTTWNTTLALPTGSPGVPTEIFGRAFATSRGFVVSAYAATTEHRVVLWFSPDGIVWQQAEATPFLAPSEQARKPGIESDVYDVTQQGGQLVAIGEVRTGARNQPYGLAPCVWTSHDGLTWTRRLIEIGKGFDPYLEWLLPRGSGYIGGGQIDKAAAMWTTKDLVTWHRVEDAPPSSIRPLVTGSGFVGLGQTVVRPQKVVKHKVVREAVVRPSIWRSADGVRWKRVLALAPERGYGASFTVLGTDGTALVLVHQLTGNAMPVKVFTSADGLIWGRITTPPDAFPPGTNLYEGGTSGGTTFLFGRIVFAPAAWQSGPS